MIRWKATLERAVAIGFRPGSDLGETLIRKSNATTDQYSWVITKVRKVEADEGRTLIGDERHRVHFKELTEAAVVQEHIKYDRNLASGAQDVEKVATGTADGKNRKRGRGMKTKTPTDTNEGGAAADTAAPPKENNDRPSKKRKKRGTAIGAGFFV